jgi:hypothetical protein
MSTTAFRFEETEMLANAAREAINARLRLLPEGEIPDFWEIVAKGYCTAKPPEDERAASLT